MVWGPQEFEGLKSYQKSQEITSNIIHPEILSSDPLIKSYLGIREVHFLLPA